jgi:hypothetical protein
MKLPSIRKIADDALNTARRFPLPLLSAFVATTALVIIMDHEGPAQPTFLWGTLLAGVLGIPFLCSTTLLAERLTGRKITGLTIQAAAIILLLGFAFSVPTELTNAPGMHVVRWLLLFFAAHMLVAIIPNASGNNVIAFWQHNKSLFIRILITGLFAAIVFAGLAFALAALDNLFGMHIPGKRYGQLWALVAGIFTTWFFHAGVPEQTEKLEDLADYPKALKVFAQYILLPIVLVYLAILYAYMAKILISWDWPQGWVSKLILGFSGAGILSLLLLHPLERNNDQTLISKLSRWFYLSLTPLVIMLFLAVSRRVGEYGMTEGRYAAIGLGVWLVIIIFYFLLLPGKNIKFIPVSLCVGALIMSFGPWDMFNTAERSQTARLETLLSKNSILVDGKVKKATGNLTRRDTREISAILAYLHDMHGYESIQPWFHEILREDTTKAGVRYSGPSAVAEKMGVRYTLVHQEPGSMISVSAERDTTYDIHGYEGLVRLLRISAEQSDRRREIGKFVFRTSKDLDSLTVFTGKGESQSDSVRLNIRQLVDRIMAAHDSLGVTNLSPGEMTIAAESGTLRIKLYLLDVMLEKSEERIKILNYSGYVLYAVEEKKENPPAATRPVE